MMVSGIVMRPVDERRPAAIVHHLAADLDAIAGLHRTSRRDADVVHDLDTAGAVCPSKASCIACERDP